MVKTYAEEIDAVRKLMKVGISLTYASRTELGFGGSKTERIKERAVDLDIIYLREGRWHLVEMNTKVILHYKIHRTRKKREWHNWMEFELDISTIIEPVKELTEVLEDMRLVGDELAADVLGGWQFDGVNPESIDIDNYDTEETSEVATYPEADYEWLIRSPTYPAGTTGRGSRRL